MLVKDLIVEACVANCEACELPSVAVWVSAALDSSCYQTMLKQLFIEEPGVSTQVPNQIAHFSPDTCIFMLDESLQLSIDVCIVYWFVKFF